MPRVFLSLSESEPRTVLEARACYPGVPVRPWVMETPGPPRFLDEPQCERALFFDPGRTQCARPLRRLSMAAELKNAVGSHERMFFRGSIARLVHSLSTLRRMGLPTATQDSLLAVGQTPPDGTGYPLRFNQKGFCAIASSHVLLPQASPGALFTHISSHRACEKFARSTFNQRFSSFFHSYTF